jgi:hypothetical protein
MSSRSRDSEQEVQPAVAEASRVLRELERSLPVSDLMGWLIGTLPLANRDEVFKILKAIYEAGFEITSASPTAQPYKIGQEAFQACPQRVTARRAR